MGYAIIALQIKKRSTTMTDVVEKRRQKIEALKNSPMAKKMIFKDGNMVTPIDENHPKFGLAGMIGHITETSETENGIQYTVRWNDDFYNPAKMMESEIARFQVKPQPVERSNISLDSWLKLYEENRYHGD